MKSSPVLFAASALALAGCQGVGHNTMIGAGAGAVAGAGLGALAGGDDRRNAVIGATVGAIAGGAAGAYMDKQEKALREAARGTGIEIERQGDQIALTMPANVTFAHDSADIRPDFYAPLTDVAGALVEHPSTLVDIIGHASADGSDAYNQRLSERRAASVQAFLSARGLQGERARAYGLGETQPVADNATPEGRAANRRVEILLTPVVEDQGAAYAAR